MKTLRGGNSFMYDKYIFNLDHIARVWVDYDGDKSEVNIEMSTRRIVTITVDYNEAQRVHNSIIRLMGTVEL